MAALTSNRSFLATGRGKVTLALLCAVDVPGRHGRRRS